MTFNYWERQRNRGPENFDQGPFNDFWGLAPFERPRCVMMGYDGVAARDVSQLFATARLDTVEGPRQDTERSGRHSATSDTALS